LLSGADAFPGEFIHQTFWLSLFLNIVCLVSCLFQIWCLFLFYFITFGCSCRSSCE